MLHILLLSSPCFIYGKLTRSDIEINTLTTNTHAVSNQAISSNICHYVQTRDYDGPKLFLTVAV